MAAQRIRLAENYGKLPLSFEANQGQMNARDKFLARGRGYSLFLTADEAVLTLGRPSQKANGKSQKAKVKKPGEEIRNSELETGSSKLATRQSSHVTPAQAGLRTTDKGPLTTDSILSLKLVGANTRAAVTGADELPGKSNYFIGNDPAKWRPNVPNYAEVKYAGVYPGVDLIYYGNQGGQLEYDFVVAPGADPSAIKLDISAIRELPTVPTVSNRRASGGTPPLQEGASPPLGTAPQIAADGDLVIGTGAGEVRFHRPIVYQPDPPSKAASSGSSLGTRHSSLLDGHYVLQANHQVGFKITSYDHTRPLVIDPVLTYSTYLGGSESDEGYGIAVDASGNAYVTGQTYSTDFPTANPFQATCDGCSTTSSDAFVAKLSADGSTLLYSTYLGGSGLDIGRGIAVDSSGNAYVTGRTFSTDFPTVNPLQANNRGFQNGFVSKLNAAGSALIYSTYLGGSGEDHAYAIAVDSTGAAYVTGRTNSPNFPLANPFQGTCGACSVGSFDAFVTKLNAAGTALVYSTFLGGSNYDGAWGIALDAAGDAYVTGGTESTDFPVVNPIQPVCGGCSVGTYDAFVAELNAAGSALVYSTYLGGNHGAFGYGITVDSGGNAYVTGYTASTNFPLVNPFQAVCAGCTIGYDDAFVSKLNAAGSALVYSTYLGGSTGNEGYGIAVDPSGNAYVTGFTDSTDFPTLNPFEATCYGGDDAFVAALNPSGSGLVYSTYLGGSDVDTGQGIAVDSSGSAYVTGSATSPDFPTANAFQPVYQGNGDAFLAKLSPGGGGPAVQLSPSRLTFGNQDLGVTGKPQKVTLSNTGDATLFVSSIVPPSGFAQTNNCGSSVSMGSKCTISVTFAPTFLAIWSGAISISDNAGAGQQPIWLTGTAINAGASLAPASESFSNQALGTTSVARNVILKSTGTTNLDISDITLTGTNANDFAEEDTCPASLAPGANCIIFLTYTPTVLGAETAGLTVADNAANSPQAVALSGNSLLPVTLTPTSLSFGNQAEDTASSPKAMTLTNNLATALAISVVTTNADFAQTNTCGGNVPAKGKCTISVTYTPGITGAETGALAVTDAASNSPQTASLTGTGIAQATVSPLSLSFAAQKAGTTSAAKTVTLTNNLSTALTVGAVTFTGAEAGDFASPTNTCGGSLAAKSKCTISVTFTPTATGARTATMNVSDSASNSPQTVTLTGTGK